MDESGDARERGEEERQEVGEREQERGSRREGEREQERGRRREGAGERG